MVVTPGVTSVVFLFVNTSDSFWGFSEHAVRHIQTHAAHTFTTKLQHVCSRTLSLSAASTGCKEMFVVWTDLGTPEALFRAEATVQA